MSALSYRAPLWALAFAEAPAALCVSRGSRVAECNSAFLGLFGFQSDGVTGRSLAIFCKSWADFRSQRCTYFQRVQKGTLGKCELMLRRADGREIVCSVSARTTGAAGLVVWMVEEIGRREPERGLSPRELEVADLLIQGQTAKQMARRLGLSPRTVEMHRANLMKKFSAPTTPALVAILSMNRTPSFTQS